MVTSYDENMGKLSTALAAASWDDNALQEVSELIVQRLFAAVRAQLVDDALSNDEKRDEVWEALCSAVHWALHTGQGAWQLLSSKPRRVSQRKRSDEWWEAVENLYLRPMIMLEFSDYPISHLLSTVRIESHFFPYDLCKSLRKGKSVSVCIPYTAARLQCAAHPQEARAVGGSSPDVIAALEERLYEAAHMYIANLNRLVGSEELNSSQTVDCFVSSCAVALSMSGDALRLLWPVGGSR